jgi:hypothetical protein
MASQQEIERLVGQALIDDDFRYRLLNDPENTAQTLGIRLTGDEVARIRRVDHGEADRLAAEFQRKGASSQREVGTAGLW